MFHPRYQTFENARVQVFKHPIAAPHPTGFNGGPVLPFPSDQPLRHTRFWKPVDVFDQDQTFDATLNGSYVYSGPAYGHFGHVMSEMVHRIIPSMRIFAADQIETAAIRWLFVTAKGEAAGYESLRPFFREILRFCDIHPDYVTLVNRNAIVERLSICEQGSDFGGGPKPGYLDDVREFSEPRMNRLHGRAEAKTKVYVSRSKLEPRGAM